MKKMIIGVTGSTGGLGRRLSEILNQKGFQLKCLVRRCHRDAKQVRDTFCDMQRYLSYHQLIDEKKDTQQKQFKEGRAYCN